MNDWPIGVLNDEQLNTIVTEKFVQNFPCNEGIDGSAIDLHLSDKAWKVNSTSKLQENSTVENLLKEQKAKEISLSDETLKKDSIYIIKLEEELAFNKFPRRYGLFGRASGRSSIGRLDVLTRLIVNKSARYDEVPAAYNGQLFLEVVPLSFHIKVKKGDSLNQLRIFHGKPMLSEFGTKELSDCAPMLYSSKGSPLLADPELLCVNLEPDPRWKKQEVIAYRAKLNDKTVNITLGKESHDPKEYFDSVSPNKEKNSLVMETNNFYILRSLERMFLPNDVAVTCVAYTENLGELRIHYAGFAHPNFGRPKEVNEDRPIGTPLIFEARCHSFEVTLHGHEHFAKIMYYKMSKPTNKESGYSNQELTLSSYFSKWKEDAPS